MSAEAIRAGDRYTTKLGFPMVASCDGALVRHPQTGDVFLVPDVRLVAILNQLGRYRVKERHGGEGAAK
jgi:hypothetical protein